MRKEIKDIIIVEIGEKFRESPRFYLVDLTGLNTRVTSALRRKCFKHEIKMVVMENTLLRRVLDASDIDYEPLYDSSKGSIAVISTQATNVPVKLLKEYQKERIPALKTAYAEESIYVSTDKLAELAALKNKSEVIAEIVALLQSPTRNAVLALQSGASIIYGVLKTLDERPE